MVLVYLIVKICCQCVVLGSTNISDNGSVYSDLGSKLGVHRIGSRHTCVYETKPESRCVESKLDRQIYFTFLSVATRRG
jgi:hypothetical protein